MKREKKEKEVAWLREQFQGVRALFLTNYQGLTVGEMNRLRSSLREAGVSYKVLKNTLTRLAYPGTDVAALERDVVGPRAAAWTHDENQAPQMAKILTDFAKNQPKLELIRGVLGGQVLGPDALLDLSKLPPREVLVARLLGSMIAPVGALVNTLAAIPRSFLNVLKAIEEQKEGSSEPAAQ